ncbi:MAG: AAA domain-containing protein [Microscillaceae bacterium]|jgi:superfamily I DNA and/or RNA helicase|nr:AAA domain-containing protein [Microscillaceae bacterium]
MQDLKKLLQLIEIEKQEALRQYQNQIVMTPLSERKKKGLSWYPIQVNHAEIGAGENFYLSIERKTQLDQNSAFQVGDSVSLFHNSEQKAKNPAIPGVITALWRNAMRVSFNIEELPEWIDYGNLGIDFLLDTASFQEMETAVNQVIKAENTRLAQLREILTGKQKADFRPENEIPTYYEIATLNTSQNAAIRNVLAAKDIAIIHGPPGTGKTTTMVEAIKLTLQTEKQVLVTAPSNTAVDLLSERLVKKGVKVLRIGNPARIDEELMSLSLEAQIAQHPDYKHLKSLRRQAEEFRKMASKYKRHFGPAEREQRKLLYAEATQRLNEATILEKYIVESLLNQAQVITATLVGSVNKYIRFRKFSTVFIDEAAQALEPACWIPIAKAERVVMAGDHCQLPPTIKSYEAAQAGLSQTLFEKIIQNQAADVMLKTQYRMNELIMNFSNQQFYHNQLQAAESVKNHTLFNPPPSGELEGALAFEFIDTAGCGFEEKMNTETQSRYNPEEAELLIKHLSRLLHYLRDVEPSVLANNFSVGVISPYSAQVSHLQEFLLQHPDIEEFKSFININSIDGFQGQEREVIYISLVRSNDKGQIGFLSDTRRMNVALTRARKKLVVIGDSATLGQNPFYLSFLDYVEQIGAYKSAWELQG